MKAKIVTVLGARPQFIKAATISRQIKERSDTLEEVIVHTGQHFDKDMSDIFFSEMDIPTPTYQLNINGGGHGKMTGKMLELVEEVLIKEKPQAVLVYGDTNSTLAGALAASKLHIKIAHIESGLRSFNTHMPEEINRILTDRISSWLFCPTDVSVTNLLNEGYDKIAAEIHKTGDVMFDAVKYYESKTQEDPLIDGEYVLCTIHRAENTDDPEKLVNIVGALNEINEKIKVILPLHPRTKNQLKSLGIKLNFSTQNPVGYLDMLNLLKHSKLVMTDSGGLQKEAYFFKKYCITLREQTEWVELVENGVNYLAGSDKMKILSCFSQIDDSKSSFDTKLYGSGNAAQKITDILSERL